MQPEPAAGSSPSRIRVAAIVATPEAQSWLDALALPAARFDVLPVEPSRDQPGAPDFQFILGAMTEADCCLILEDDLFSRLARVAADHLGIPVFALVSTAEELANLPQREKSPPDLYFIARSTLLPVALNDARYGLTVLPTGHPARDLHLREGGHAAFADAAFGDGKASARISNAIERWAGGQLDTSVPDLSIVIPAYRESANVSVVCDRLLEALEPEPIAYEILVIDDSSPDDTFERATEQMWKSPRIRAFTKPTPRGMGNAIRYGMGRSRAPVVAITMGDGSDEVGRIPVMFRKLRDENLGLVIGSRYGMKENYAAVPILYRLWSRVFRLTTWAAIGFHLRDYTNAFRVFDRRIFARYGPESGGFEISPEITFKAWFATRRVGEVDVRHLKRASGQSSFSFLRAGPGYGKILIKAFINRFTGRWFTLDW